MIEPTYRIARPRTVPVGALAIAMAMVTAGCASHAPDHRGQEAGAAAVLDATSNPVEPVPDRVTSELESSIRRHIDQTTAASGGLFPIEFEGKDLRLKLVRVHTEYLSTVGENLHFACVDLATADGDVYDVDFFMRGTTTDAVVTQTSVHKLNGRPYYVWEQDENKRWRMRPVDQASNSLLGVVNDHDDFTFTYQVLLPEISGTARMWVPVASTDDFQTVSVERVISPGTTRMVRDRTEGNHILVVDMDSAASGQKLEIRYHCHRREKSAYRGSERAAQRYLNPERLVPNDEQFVTIADSVVKGKTTTLEKARALYDHTMERIKYTKYGPAWGNGDAHYACDAAAGNCTDFHAYFIALCRAIGIPARFAIGASIPSDRAFGSMDGYHCWAEFYADGHWWPVDISEADKYATLAGYYFGHHPANRIEFSRGRDLVVDPMPASGSINFLAYPVLEINGEPVQAKTIFGFRRTGTGAG